MPAPATRLPILLILLLALTACASTSRQMSELESAQYAWSGAIRWGDFEGAWNLVDPEVREANPLTNLHFERYKQVRISSYRELGARVGDTQAVREVELGVINNHTMAERTLRYTERWRYDAEARTWWVSSGLPDLWDDR